MGERIRTNELIGVRYGEALLDNYSIFVVETSDKYFKAGALALDLPQSVDEQENGRRVAGICFEYGKKFWVLAYKKQDNFSWLQNALAKETTVRLSEVSFKEVPENILLQLFFNALAERTRGNTLGNVSGKLYAFNPAWMHNWPRHPKGAEADQRWALEISITKEMLLSIRLVTFTSRRMKKKIDFSRKPYDAYPKYTYGANNCFRRKLKNDDGEEYIIRQVRGRKNNEKYFAFATLDSFLKARLGVLQQLLEKFKQRYRDGICFVFKEYEATDIERLELDNEILKSNVARLQKACEGTVINVFTEERDEEAIASIAKVVGMLNNEKTGTTAEYGMNGIQAVLGQEPQEHLVNLQLVHEKKWYEKPDDDTYRQSEGKYVLQHLELETVKKFKRSDSFPAALRSCCLNILIKRDLQQRKITLFDWPSLGLDQDLVFVLKGTREVEKNVEKAVFYFMTVQPDGTLEAFSREDDFFAPEDYYSSIITAWQGLEAEGKNPIAMIASPEDGCNAFFDTGKITLPEIEAIFEELKAGKKMSRGQEARQEYFSAVLDICYIPQGEKAGEFFVGKIGYGMDNKGMNACRVRRVEACGGANLFFCQLLPTMSVIFIRNGQLTVMPFVFKYLREYFYL